MLQAILRKQCDESSVIERRIHDNVGRGGFFHEKRYFIVLGGTTELTKSSFNVEESSSGRK